MSVVIEREPAEAKGGAVAGERAVRTVTLIPGDGIGPEVTAAARRVLEATGVRLDWEVREAGASVFRQGLSSGVPEETIESIRKTRLVLKGPLETPVGFGEKSANVTLRKLFETYANVRPVREMPGVPTPYAGRGIDLIIVRENVEDLYAGIEHMQTPGVAQCLKLMSRKGCEKIVRIAFELAVAEGRTSIHCATKANIMKLTEGLLKRTFEEIAPEYPQIRAEHIIVDNAAHQLVRFPEAFEILVMSNMNGDILSDLTSGLVGGLGFAPSANLGSEVAIFEAVHGSAPKYAGKDVANPTAVLLSAVLMLRHLGEIEAAARVENALFVTLEKGIHTRDVSKSDAVGTQKFADAVIANFGWISEHWHARDYRPLRMPVSAAHGAIVPAVPRKTAGVDVFVETDLAPNALGASLEDLALETQFALKMVSNRGTKVYPMGSAMTDCVDHFRCRFFPRQPGAEVLDGAILDLLSRITRRYRWMHVEKLEEIGGKPGWTKAQGED
ncbi:MAG: NADP-dependent isocitrate dehydrogenase [Acidobacteriota bacterium]|nr:NADP-dependent isocitrate dehydrogenase [Acidobacteriota bacterium]